MCAMYKYLDDGCPNLGIPHCLECPLQRCIHDAPPGRCTTRSATKELSKVEARRLTKLGKSASEVARVVGRSKRTIERWLKEV